MTEYQAQRFQNIEFDERDYYKGEFIFRRHHSISYEFAKVVDCMATFAKNAIKRKVYFLVHDFNNYEHGKRSAHYGDPDLEVIDRKCVACDYRLKGVRPIDQVKIAMLFPFTGILFYPYSKIFFIHVDMKWWDRPRDKRMTLGFKNKNGKFITTNHNYIKVMQMIETLEEMEAE